MSRPQSESEYLARLIPPSVAATGVSRRGFLKGTLGAGASMTLASLLAGCGGGDDSSGSGGGGGGGGGTVTFGINEKGTPFAKQFEAEIADFTKRSGTQVKSNNVDHNTFQENINNYLQGSADDVFTWFAGDRLRFFAKRGLIGDVSDVWPIEGLSDAFKAASTADDGKQYFVPQSYYPWAVFFRKSVFEKNGYTVPKTLDEMTALATKMKSDGLVPIAFADKDGWPAMGTFDALNMRINGFDYHIALMKGEEAWDSAKTKKVFETWKALLPFHQPDALGRTWQEAAASLQQRKSGMYLLGTFMTAQFPAAERADIDFFTFPEVDSTIGADAIDAPIDGSCMSAKPKNEKGAKALLKYIGSPEAANAAAAIGEPFIAANEKADTSKYSDAQKKSKELVGQARNLGQFLDRDTRPDFASTVIIQAFQQFIKEPDDIDGLTKSIESQKKSIFAG